MSTSSKWLNNLTMYQRVKAVAELRGYRNNGYQVFWRFRGKVLNVILQDIYFADFNEEEQKDAVKNWKEVTAIGLGKTWIPLSLIDDIKQFDMEPDMVYEVLDDEHETRNLYEDKNNEVIKNWVVK